MYQIKEWDKHYENAASRKVDFCSWCPVPNKQDGLGYTLLVQGRNGSARYGAFVAVLMVASKQEKPRNGWLTHNGKPDGRALTSYDLSLVTKLPEKIIEEMLLRASQPDIDWISPSSDSALPAVYQQSDSALERSGNIKEQKEQKGIEGKEEEPLTDYEQKIETYFSTKINRAMIIAWNNAHRTISVDEEILKAKAWLFSNQDKKQYTRFGKFLGNWMTNASNPPEWMKGKEEESIPPYTQACKVCGEPATKTIEGHGSYCTKHSPYDSGEPGGV